MTTQHEFEERVRQVRLVAFDFDGVFTDNFVYCFSDASEAVRCYRGDGIGLRKLERLGIRMMILSAETNPIVSVRARKLGIPFVQGCGDKLAALKTAARELGLSLAQVAYVGNDENDLSCLAEVGLPIAVQDAHPAVRRQALFHTEARGGYGAVREICDRFERILSPAQDQVL